MSVTWFCESDLELEDEGCVTSLINVKNTNGCSNCAVQEQGTMSSCTYAVCLHQRCDLHDLKRHVFVTRRCAQMLQEI